MGRRLSFLEQWGERERSLDSTEMSIFQEHREASPLLCPCPSGSQTTMRWHTGVSSYCFVYLFESRACSYISIIIEDPILFIFNPKSPPNSSPVIYTTILCPFLFCPIFKIKNLVYVPHMLLGARPSTGPGSWSIYHDQGLRKNDRAHEFLPSPCWNVSWFGPT